MLTIAEAQRRTELFLTSQMFEALHAVEYELPSFDTEAREVQLADVARSRVEIRHVRGASDATYLVNAFGNELLMRLQLNVHRLVVVYRVPELDALEDELQQLYWRTDIAQMTRYYMIEAARGGIRLSPRRPGFPVCVGCVLALIFG
jgi:hypothetical protein